jgi:Gpi16 subunit, GPI transamidase component
MPYNVIILSSTVIALAFGSVFNLLVRRFVALEPGEVLVGNKLRGLILLIVAFVKGRIRKFQNRRKKVVQEINRVVQEDKGKDLGVEK